MLFQCPNGDVKAPKALMDNSKNNLVQKITEDHHTCHLQTDLMHLKAAVGAETDTLFTVTVKKFFYFITSTKKSLGV